MLRYNSLSYGSLRAQTTTMDINEIECHFKWRPCEGDPNGDPEKCIDHLTENFDFYSKKDLAYLLIGYLNTQIPQPDYVKAVSIFDAVLKQCGNGTPKTDEHKAYTIIAMGNKIHTLKLIYELGAAAHQAILLRRLGVPSDKALACIKAVHAFSLTVFNDEKYDDSLRLYQEAMELDPENPYWKIEFAYMAGKRRKTVENFRNCCTAMEEEPLREAIRLTNWTDFHPILILAELLFAQGRKSRYFPRDDAVLGESMALFDKALELEPDNCNVLMRCGKPYHASGKKELGLKCLQKAVQLNPHNPIALYRLGQCYSFYNNDEAMLDKAEHYLEEAVTVGLRRHFFAELELGSLKKKRNKRFDLKKYYEDMKAYYCYVPKHVEILNEKIESIEQYRLKQREKANFAT